MKTSQHHADTESARLWDRVRKVEYDNSEAAARISRLEADLLECREFIERFVDVVDSSDGPAPNAAMALVSMIDATIARSSGERS